jgi:branched-chain amino acid transport system permease protein
MDLAVSLPLVAGLDFSTLPQQLVNGLLAGSIYALIALGYTMVYGVLRLINFAHGEVFMIGAYTSLITTWSLGYVRGSDLEAKNPGHLILLLLVSMVVCGLLGILIERVAYRPMRSQPRIASLITAIGVSLLLQAGAQLFLPVSPPPSISEKVNPYRGVITLNLTAPDATLGNKVEATTATFTAAETAWKEARANNQPNTVVIPLRDAKNKAERELNTLKSEYDNSGMKIRVPQGQAIMFGTTVALMLMLTYLVMYTPVGRKMRAVSHDFDSASLMGINVNTIVSVTFLIGSMLAGAGAMMNATFLGTPLTAQYGVMPGVKAFVAAVLGGIGNIPGAVVGGLLMGVAEAMVTWVGFGQYKDAIAFVILILILLVKPGGLLGSAKVEKV